jgi:hypothetical protein
MNADDNSPPSPTYAELHQENQSLRRRLEVIQTENRTVWKLLFETNRRLQLSSAAIKASVSSLLNYDIFWDGTNQHEFLETINSSIDQVSRQITMLTLLFRLKAGTLEFRRDYQSLDEILSVVQDHISQRVDGLSLETALPADRKPVLVNYDYLVIALEYLIEAAAQYGANKIKIEAVESPVGWKTALIGPPAAFNQKVQALLIDQEALSEPNDVLTADDTLRLWLAIHLLLQQGIRLETAEQPVGSGYLQLLFPTQAGE